MTVAGQTADSYAFDDDRLTGITRGTASVSLAYDDADRRTSLTLPNRAAIIRTSASYSSAFAPVSEISARRVFFR